MLHSVLNIPSPACKRALPNVALTSIPSNYHIRPASTSMALLYCLNATTVVHLIKHDFITIEEYARNLLGRIEERDSTVKAWVYLGKLFILLSLPSTYIGRYVKLYIDFAVDPAFVISQAQALDRIPRDQRGPLHGVAIGVKDTMNTKGTVPCGSLMTGNIAYARQTCPHNLALLCTKDISLALIRLQLRFYELLVLLSSVRRLICSAPCT